MGKKHTVGFIGLGLMGNPMAKNILKAGYPLIVYNRTKSKTKELEKLGAKVAKTPAELGSIVDVIVTMVTAPTDVEKVIFGKGGIVNTDNKDLIIVDMSTIGQSAVKNIASKLHQFGIDFLDAPVTGSTPKAISGELTIFIGGKIEVFNRVKPVLLAMGKTLHYMGPAGSGQAVKLLNNFLFAAGTIALSEAMILADIMQLPRKKAIDALQTATGVSPAMLLAMPNFLTNQFPVKFSLGNLKKDVSLAVEELKNGRVNLPILKLTQELYNQAVKEQLSDEDFSAIIKIIKV